MATDLTFGQWLKRRRSGLGFTQAELGRRVGYAVATIRKIEGDEMRPSRQLAEKLADELAIAAEERAAFIRFARDEGEPPALPTLAAASVPTPPSPAPPPSAATVPPSGTVTFLFTDIEGSSALWERHPQAMAHSLAHHHALLRHAIETAGGYVFKLVGDAFCAAFATPQRALLAAVAAQQALQAPDATWGETGHLRVRMGIHLGPAEWDDDDYATNDTLNRASRVMAAGHGGQILLTSAVVEVVSRQPVGEVTWRDLGVHRLRGLSQPERLYQLMAPDLRVEFPSPRTLEAPRHNLPVAPTPLIGREQELATLKAWLQRETVRLVTLTGPGGVGKTRLAVQVAADEVDDFADGVYFVNLAAIDDPNLVTTTIARTLGVSEAGSRSVIESLTDFVRDKRLMLVLDNFEQVVEAGPRIADLLQAAPHLKALVTSREVLHVRGEHGFTVPPLPVPPEAKDARPGSARRAAQSGIASYAGVQLFVARAQAAKADFVLTEENAPAVAEICTRLDGLPLAIELAAARIRLLSPQAMLARLEPVLKFLTAGPRDLPARQQTLRATLDWSYGLLDEAEKALFRRLAVFVGGCTLEAAEAICNADGALPDALVSLGSLVDKNLIRQYEGADGQVRLRRLRVIREYALERLEESGEGPGLRQQHAAFFLKLAETADPHLLGREQAVWLNRLETEHDNLRAALDRCTTGGDFEVGLRLAGQLWRFWYLRGYLQEGRRWLEGVLSATAEMASAARAKALFGAGVLAWRQGDYAAAQGLHGEGLALNRQLGDRKGIADSLNNLGIIASRQGDYSQARLLYGESLALMRELGEKRGVAVLLNNLGLVAVNQGDYATARGYYTETLAIMEALGDRRNMATALNNLGEVSFAQGDDTAAAGYHEASLAIMRELGDQRGIALSLTNLGLVAWRGGNPAAASALHEESLALWREVGDKHGIAAALNNLAPVLQDQGNAMAAAAVLKESLALRQEAGDKYGIGRCLVGLAGLAMARTEPTRAGRLLGATAALLDTIGGRLDALDRQVYERTRASVQAALGEDASAAWAEGQAMPLEAAVAYALEMQRGAGPYPPI